MPDINNLLKTKLVAAHWVSNNITERQHWEEEWQPRKKQYSAIKAIKELEPLAFSDSLTTVTNRRSFELCIDQEWRLLAREQAPLSLILCDLDFFKVYNYTYGHQAGDECLQQVAKAIVRCVKRPADLVARYGGQEFVVVLPNTKSEAAVQVAEEIRSEVQSLKIAHPNSQNSKYLTLSLGVASIIPTAEYSSAMLITAAERALYQAKAQGRDCIIIYDDLLRQIKVSEL